MGEWIQKLRKIRGLGWLILAFIIGVILLVLPTETTNTTGYKGASSEGSFSFETISDIPSYEAYLAHKIAQMTNALTGASDAVVLVTLDSLPVNSAGSTSYFGADTVVKQTTVPDVRGIAVVCHGGNQPDVQLAVISMLTAAFDIPASRVYVGE